MTSDSLPQLIQGGMGIGVSNWRLAKAVSSLGHLGVISGTAMDVVLARRLQQGDPGGHMLRALGHFPKQDLVAPLIARYYPPDGIPAKEGYRATPLSRLEMPKETETLLMAANFVEVFLARENHPGIVGINLMEKIQLPTLAVLYGAMLAGVDYVLIGAGIPNHIPAVLDALAAGEPATLKIDVVGAAEGSTYTISFDPREFWQGNPPVLKRPHFIPIVSSATLALSLSKKAQGKITGFIVEGSSAGGHNAPPRGQMQLNTRGEPIYGPRDLPDMERFRQLGYPFWLAGSYWGPGMLDSALAVGATGIQVGTPFAFCEESGVALGLKQQVLKKVRDGTIEVLTDPLASPTGFPFKIVGLEGSASSPEVEQKRSRVCDIGLLRQAYAKPDGTVGYRCASEDAGDYVRKGGKPESTAGRKCICNGLLSTIGLGQTTRSGVIEPPLVTAGDSLAELKAFLRPDSLSYSAADVVHILTSAVSCRTEGA
ncbi:MAG: nitronate monooxygenase [Methylacidiphilales bacterium]|nr:nitronate monooxygenase [Candidatus Methylacidiphilales bacterium]